MDFNLNNEQFKAIQSVERAFKKAEKLGVHFWSNHGTLTAYNANKITTPKPYLNPSEAEYAVTNNEEIFESLTISNFHAENADDALFFNSI